MKKIAFTIAELCLIFFIMAVLAVLFYRTLKPDQIIYNNLYYAAYTQMETAYREVLAYDDPTTNDATQKNVYTDGKFDISKYCTIFNKIVNFLGNGVNEHYDAATEFAYNEAAEYYPIADVADVFEDGKYSTLSNGMRIRFDRFKLNGVTDSDGNQPIILVATMDINGAELPNEYNKDIIQIEINGNGIFPIGDLGNNADILKFNVYSRYNGVQMITGVENPISGPEHVVVQGDDIAVNLNYDTAACKADLHHHTYLDLQSESEKCGSIKVLNECKYDRLKCTADAVKP